MNRLYNVCKYGELDKKFSEPGGILAIMSVRDKLFEIVTDAFSMMDAPFELKDVRPATKDEVYALVISSSDKSFDVNETSVRLYIVEYLYDGIEKQMKINLPYINKNNEFLKGGKINLLTPVLEDGIISNTIATILTKFSRGKVNIFQANVDMVVDGYGVATPMLVSTDFYNRDKNDSEVKKKRLADWTPPISMIDIGLHGITDYLRRGKHKADDFIIEKVDVKSKKRKGMTMYEHSQTITLQTRNGISPDTYHNGAFMYRVYAKTGDVRLNELAKALCYCGTLDGKHMSDYITSYIIGKEDQDILMTVISYVIFKYRDNDRMHSILGFFDLIRLYLNSNAEREFASMGLNISNMSEYFDFIYSNYTVIRGNNVIDVRKKRFGVIYTMMFGIMTVLNRQTQIVNENYRKNKNNMQQIMRIWNVTPNVILRSDLMNGLLVFSTKENKSDSDFTNRLSLNYQDVANGVKHSSRAAGSTGEPTTDIMKTHTYDGVMVGSLLCQKKISANPTIANPMVKITDSGNPIVVTNNDVVEGLTLTIDNKLNPKI